MTEHYSSFGEAAGAAMAHNARTAARHNAERAAEEQTAEAPRDGLSAPLSAPHSPDDTQDPDGRDNASDGRTANPDRAELCRQFKAAITRRWDVGPFVVDEIVDDAVDCHLGLAARATADLRAQLAEQAAIDTQVMEKADRECDEHIAAGRAFRQLAERTQAWGEQHRDRANRYRARVDRALRRLDAWEQQLPETVLTATVLEVLRGDLAPQAGDDTTGATP